MAVAFGKVTWVEPLMADVMLIPFKYSSVSKYYRRRSLIVNETTD